MLLATASQAAFERSSSGRMMTWLRMPTRPFLRRKPMKGSWPTFLPRDFTTAGAFAISPPLGLDVVDVDVAALADRGHHAADVVPVFEHGLALLEAAERDLVAERDGVERLHLDRPVALHHPACQRL